jgi:hypothetical protein
MGDLLQKSNIETCNDRKRALRQTVLHCVAKPTAYRMMISIAPEEVPLQKCLNCLIVEAMAGRGSDSPNNIAVYIKRVVRLTEGGRNIL